MAVFAVSCRTAVPTETTSRGELKEIVNSSETTLVDVRIPAEYVENAVKGAVNIPLASIKKNIDYFKAQKKIVVFCNSGRQATEALKILRRNGISNVYSGKTLNNILALQQEKNKMNILEDITFSGEKPSVFSIKKTDKIKYIAVALGKGAVLKKHTASVPTTLLVLKGEINFIIEGKTIHLNSFDIYEIPVNVEHEVVGVSEENLFSLTQEL